MSNTQQGIGAHTTRVFMISFDLGILTNQTPFFEAIKANSLAWCHYLKNTWLVKTILSEAAMSQALYPHMTQTDRLLIMEVRGTGAGWLEKDAWEWIVQNVEGPESVMKLFEAWSKVQLKVLPPPRQ